jgi:hypothetical protein
MSGHYRKEKNCLNCGHLVEEHYCSHCGQPNLELKEPFWHFMGHSIGHYFHFDSKFFHTLIPLLSKPGQLTLDYLAGKRARYIHPVSLYIFVSIVYFIVIPHTLKEEKDDPKERQEQIDSAAKAFNENKGDLDAIAPDVSRKVSDVLGADAQFKKLAIKSQIRYVDSLKKIQAVKPTDYLEDKIDRYGEIITDKKDSTYASYLQRQKSLSSDEQDPWWVKKLKKKAYTKKAETGTSGHKIDIKEELKKYQPKQYFLLMPLLALFIMVNFRKNRIYYIDHLVFTIHGMTAYFIISILTKPLQKYVFGLGSFMSETIEVLVFAGIVWYLYSGLKLFYNRSRNMTIRKTITVMIMYTIALAISEQIIKETIILFH